MGSWNGTCGLSGLPITWNTDAALFLLEPGTRLDDGRGGFCYPTDEWRPVCPPLFGKYNDSHGTIDLDESPPWHWKMTQKRLDKLKLVWQDHRELEPEDPEEGEPLSAAYDYETFLRHIERGWVKASALFHPNEIRPIGQMLVRRDVWNYLRGMQYQSHHCVLSPDTHRQHARELVEYIVANRPPSDPEAGLMWSFGLETHFLHGSDEYSTLYRYLFATGSGIPQFGLYRIELCWGIVRGVVSPEEAVEILYEISDVAHVNELMMHLRRAWRPQPGAGSQNEDWDLHGRFADTVSRIARREVARGQEDE